MCHVKSSSVSSYQVLFCESVTDFEMADYSRQMPHPHTKQWQAFVVVQVLKPLAFCCGKLK